ncbi:hypothetical protein LC593_28800 [Nostoc sp. CHAB 5844]|nr:hypothetical protein [Nostoc sp. CHAB 5844]
MQLITVNNAIDYLDTLNAKYLYLEGLLTFEFENMCVSHWPKAEHRENSSIWLDVGIGAFRFNEPVLSR